MTQKADVYVYGVILMELITGGHALTQGRTMANGQYIEHLSIVDSVSILCALTNSGLHKAV